MDDHLGMKHTDGGDGTAIDAVVLDQILNIGDDRLRNALLEQLMADFDRISFALTDGPLDKVGAAAHELKGLAATIGAHRLAHLARTLNSVADHVAPTDLTHFRAPVEGEIRVVVDHLAIHAGRARP